MIFFKAPNWWINLDMFSNFNVMNSNMKVWIPNSYMNSSKWIQNIFHGHQSLNSHKYIYDSIIMNSYTFYDMNSEINSLLWKIIMCNCYHVLNHIRTWNQEVPRFSWGSRWRPWGDPGWAPSQSLSRSCRPPAGYSARLTSLSIRIRLLRRLAPWLKHSLVCLVTGPGRSLTVPTPRRWLADSEVVSESARSSEDGSLILSPSGGAPLPADYLSEADALCDVGSFAGTALSRPESKPGIGENAENTDQETTCSEVR